MGYDVKNKLIDPFSSPNRLKVHVCSVIYFLFDDESLVYVGKSVRGLERVYEHKDKQFTHVVLQYCDTDYLDELEQAYIAIYKPKYNIVKPTYKCKWSYSVMTYRDYHTKSVSLRLEPYFHRPHLNDTHDERLSNYLATRDNGSGI